MRSFLTDLLLFVLVALVVYTAVIIGAGALSPFSEHRNIKFAKGAYGHLYSRTREIPAHADVDILFLGSSHAYRGFDPRLFEARGLRTFNLGSSSQSPLQTKLLVDRYREHLNPRLVVMDVYPLTFDIDGVESALDLIANDTIRWDMLHMALELKNIGVLNTLLYGTYRQLFGLDAEFLEPIVINNATSAGTPGLGPTGIPASLVCSDDGPVEVTWYSGDPDTNTRDQRTPLFDRGTGNAGNAFWPLRTLLGPE
jgi:hypothetical protein